MRLKRFLFCSALLLTSSLMIQIGLRAKNNQEPIEVHAAQKNYNFDPYTYEGSYYDSLPNSPTQGMNGTLRTSLSSLIQPEAYYTYSGSGDNCLSTVLQSADEDPENPNNMIYFYSRDSVTKNAASSWNREHVWPQSLSVNASGTELWGKTKAGTDILHIRPTYEGTNSSRNNNIYAETNNADVRNHSITGYEFGYGKGVFEPLACNKGDAARIIMYIWVAHQNTYDSMSDITNVFESYDTMMNWHIEDTPDLLEGNRNDFCETSIQKNRNPFVDHPEYAWQIFGEMCSTEVLNRAKAKYPADGSSTVTPDPDEATLESITISGYTTEFNVGDTFSFGGTVTAHYSDYSTRNVTNSCTFSGYNMSESGTQTVTVSYSTVSTTYEITVKATSSSETTITGSYYEKVTTTPNITNGEYLIVCEETSVAFNGGLTTLDAVSNNIEVEITDNKIPVSEDTTAAQFTIDASKRTIKSKSGYYIGQTSNSNGLETNTSTTFTNTISIGIDGEANILSSGGAYLRYNSASNQLRFRYYRSGTYTNQKAIQLYKLNALETAKAWATTFMDSVTCDGGVTKPNVATWNSCGTTYNNLEDGAKAYFVNATYTLSGSTVTALNGTDQTIAEAVARYDYIVGKYGTSAYQNFMTDREVLSYARTFVTMQNKTLMNSLIIVVTSCTLFGLRLIIRKKKPH